MTKSNAQFQQERNLVIENEKLRAQIADLQEKLDKAQDRNTFASGGINALEEKFTQERRAFRERIEYLESIAAPVAPLLPPETPIPEDEINAIEWVRGRNDRAILPSDKHCAVAVVIVITHGKRHEQNHKLQRNVCYPGTFENLKKELDHRIIPILTRSPSLDDVANFDRITPQQMVESMEYLSVCRYINELNDQYDASLKNHFEGRIQPHIQDVIMTRSEAFNRWQKAVDRSFHNMEERERGVRDSKKLVTRKQGRPRKLRSLHAG